MSLDTFGFDQAIHFGEAVPGSIDWPAWKNALKVTVKIPDKEEIEELEAFVAVEYRRILAEREINIMDSYREAIIYTLGVAKHQLNELQYEGGNPTEEATMASTDFVAPYVGLNQWENDITGNGNTVATLFDASATNVAGTAGTQLKVGNQVGAHLIVGYEQPGYEEGGTGYHATSRVLFYKNNTPQTVATFDVNAGSALKITLLRKPIILVGGKIGTPFKCTGYLKGTAGIPYVDTVKPLGISFLETSISRELIPSKFASSTSVLNSVVLTA